MSGPPEFPAMCGARGMRPSQICIKPTSKETATAQQPRDQDLHHSSHFFDHDYTGFDVAFAHTFQRDNESKPVDRVHYVSP
jgi:hypothetical protein